MYIKGCGGDVKAAALYLNYALGPVPPVEAVEELEELKREIEEIKAGR